MAERGRRGHGEGSIYRMADGRWAASVDLGWRNGKRQRRVVARQSRSEVVQALRRLQSERDQGGVVQPNSPTVGQWLDRYLDEVAGLKVRATTLARYEQEVRLHIKPALGQVRLDRLEPQHLARLYNDLRSTLRPNSIRRLHAFLRRALTVAERWRLLNTNPARSVDPPHAEIAVIEPLDYAEAAAFIRAVRDTRLEARWLIGLLLGARQGEVLGLQWSDIDLSNESATIRATLQRRPGGELVLAPTKTRRSTRILPLPRRVVSALEHWRAQQDLERSAAGPTWHETGYVFTTAHGTPVNPRNDYRAFQSILSRAGMRRIRLHDLRHTAASIMLAEGVPARVVMELLGHSQISVTMNTYTHVGDGLTSDAVDRLDAALSRDDHDAT